LSARVLLPAMAAAGASSVGRAADPEKLRIGYQKSSTLTIWLKSRGVLDEALAPLNVTPEWHEFASGVPLLEALNVGGLDLTADVADAVPPFALAAGAQMTYYASEAPSPTVQAIIVQNDSPVRTVAQLKGKKVAFAKGAGAHYLLLAALRSVGLSITDIEPAFLSPADGRGAFENGSAAAGVIWDPFLAAVQRQSGARILQDGQGLAAYRRFYLAATPFAKRRGDALVRLSVGVEDVDDLRADLQRALAQVQPATGRSAARAANPAGQIRPRRSQFCFFKASFAPGAIPPVLHRCADGAGRD
jgi:sulfonate transport system substrate-binding protein